MATIEKMSIMGIRSFDNRVPMAIKFDVPLTLIVGTNGSGKTTIIECLKYMSCGELPPNVGQGGMFIHDPQMAGEKDVLAQIKLAYTSAEGTRMVATRNMQLTVKGKTRSYKALEGSIKMMKDGERSTISSKVLEMNAIVPRFLGTTKAILENVIFCHQEDSSWPMSAPKELKLKFDQIFEAEKYTKAVDNIKILQKNYKTELAVLQNDETHMKGLHDKSKKVKVDRDQLIQQSDRLKRDMESHRHDRHEAEEKAQEFYKKMGEAELIVGKLDGKRVARDTKKESVESLRQNLVEMADSDDELQKMLEQYEERIQQYNDDLMRQKENFHKTAEIIDATRNKMVSKEREEAGLENEKEAYARQVESRKQLVRETARSHDIRGFDLDIDDAQVREFKARISRKAREHDAQWERARTEIQESLQTLQTELTTLNERRSAQRQTKESSRQNIVSYDRKINELQTKQNKIVYDEGSTATLQTQMQEAQEQLQQARQEQQNASWNVDVSKADTELARLKKRREELEEEMMEASRRAGDTANLDYLQKELKSTQRSLQTMSNAHQEKITSIVGSGWTVASLENDYSTALRSATTRLSEAEAQRDGSVRDTEYARSKLAQTTAELKSARDDIKRHQAAIYDALECEPGNYHAEMAELEKSRKDLGDDQKVYEFFTYSIKMAKEQDHCCLCKRGFRNKATSNKTERQAMIDSAEAMIKRYAPNASADSAATLEEINQAYQAGLDASSDFENWERLTNKVVPEKEALSSELEMQHKRFIVITEEKDSAVQEMKSAKAEVEGMSRTVQSIVKSRGDVTSYEAQIKDLWAKQNSCGSSRGMEAIQGDKKSTENEFETVSKTKLTAVSARDKLNARINSLELQCSQVKGKLATAEYQLKEKRSLQSQEDEYKALIANAKESIRNADAEIQELDAQIATISAKHEDAKQRGNERDRLLQETASKLSSSVNRLNIADQEIEAYHDRGGDDRLSRCRREIESIKSELSRVEAEQKEIIRIVKKLEDEVRKHDDTRRSITDNQRYRKDRDQYETLVKEIAALESENAEEDKERYHKQAQRWQDRRNVAGTNEARVAGELSNVDAQIAKLQADWKTDYAKAGTNYKTAHIKVETTKAAIHDLGQYQGALDKAIMKYHSLKMEEINRIVAELWRETYQGTDVDMILIKSETETVKANKSYNYRVCMIKQDVEMDMRGRCSAGQKMLASIIIRLALAECFGTNFGVITLDEPTTNLDQENIKALASSLERLVQYRRQQKNFQIIIITHDEEFLRYMNASEFTDTYYRVSRDAHQKSVIDRQSVADIM